MITIFQFRAFLHNLSIPIRRRVIQRPEVLAERMRLKPGMIIVEIGPGKGNYTKAVAERVLPGGKVYAIDIQKSVIERLKKRTEKEGITNIIPKIDDAYNLSFTNESVDRILAICTLPEIPEPGKVLREFHRILKPDGLVCLSEVLPDPDYPRRSTEKRWASEAGFELREEFGNFFLYQLNFGKNRNRLIKGLE
ncbi:MAG: class I SAM-dependent methyltransferase [Candidatus Jordarchaeum sp.]|uniref:class I SAM-dependent methyltransferase n=1 Tax=Candidatus Jordarchaeum sp. TaxID=2823881 RepID=UPI00404907DA